MDLYLLQLVWLWKEPFEKWSAVHCLIFRLAVRNDTPLDQVSLHLLQLISSVAGILIVHVTHALICCQLQAVGVAEGATARRKGPVISDLYFLENLPWIKIKRLIRHTEHCLRSYHVENTSSRLITEVKQHRARLVLGWVTAWEYLVL